MLTDPEAPLGECMVTNCTDQATMRTFLGLHLCSLHFGQFYSAEGIKKVSS